MINLLRKIVERHDEKESKKIRTQFLATTKEKVHIVGRGFATLCRAHSVYSWEEDDWEYTPYVKLGSDEERYATCKECIAAKGK